METPHTLVHKAFEKLIVQALRATAQQTEACAGGVLVLQQRAQATARRTEACVGGVQALRLLALLRAAMATQATKILFSKSFLLLFVVISESEVWGFVIRDVIFYQHWLCQIR